MKKTLIAVCCAATLALSVQAQDLKLKANEKGLVGFVDASGSVVVACKYDAAFPFENGVAVVIRKDKAGAVDASGKEIIPPKYSEILPWGNNLLLLKKGKNMGLADASGKILLEVEYSNISRPNCYGRAWVSSGGKVASSNGKSIITGAKFGIINADGGIVVPAEHKGLAEFTVTNLKEAVYEGKALGTPIMVMSDTLQTPGLYYGYGKNNTSNAEYGIIDGNGKVLVKEGEFGIVMEPQSGMVRAYNAMSKKTECFYYNLVTGKTLDIAVHKIPLANITFWTHGDFNGAWAPVNSTEGWYFIDKEGNKKLQGFAKIKHGKKAKLWAAFKQGIGIGIVLDEDGNTVFPESLNLTNIVFSENTDHQDVFPVKRNGKYGVIDRQGKTVLPFDYVDVHSITYDYLFAKKETGWGTPTRGLHRARRQGGRALCLCQHEAYRRARHQDLLVHEGRLSLLHIRHRNQAGGKGRL